MEEDYTNKILREALVSLYETEEVANSTLESLGKQKEQIKKVKGNTDEITDEQTKSNTFLSRMLKREYCILM